jgi:soluble lytic murein transglycosylase-like protein
MIVAMVSRNKTALLCFVLCVASPIYAQQARKIVVKGNKKTGKLVRVVVPVEKPVTITPSADIGKLVEDAAKANAVDPLLVHSVIQVESNYNPYAVSSAGARGLMQLMPQTAKELGVTDSFDPRQNIEAGVRYLKQLKDMYHDDRLVLAAYNAGPGAVAQSVQKYGDIPPYPETIDYVKRVGERYVEARRAAGIAPAVAPEAAPPVTPQAPLVVPTEEKHTRLESFVDEHGRLHLRTALE